MIALRQSKLDFLIGLDLKRRIIFRQSLVEPGGHLRLAEIRIHDEMNVFMKDRGICLRILALGRQRDVVDVLTGLKKSSDKGIYLAVGPLWFEILVRRVVLKNDNICLDRRGQVHLAKQQAKGFAKLFE